MRQALELALEALEEPKEHFAKHRRLEAITAIKEALAQPEQPKVRTGDCLLVGVCASEGHKIQVKQEPWRESASDYERGVIDGRQMQMQSSVDKAVNSMSQRTWVGLTMQDVKVIEDNAPSIQMAIFMAEATLKDKNHGS